MGYPEWMTSKRRWMVRGGSAGGKRAKSILESPPPNYVPKPGESKNSWRYRWNRPELWATYEDASKYAAEHQLDLTFVVHPLADEGTERLVCFDFDHAISEGALHSEVSVLLNQLSSYTEYSRSGEGLHTFFIVHTDEPFQNIPQVPLGGDVKLDVFTSNAVAVTGRTYAKGFQEVRSISNEFLSSLPFFQRKERKVSDCDVDFSEWWDDNESPLDDTHEYLIDRMENWAPAVKDYGRSSTAFAAACEILREGVIGWQALRLLQLVETTPALTEDELKHKLEDAYKATKDDGTFNTGFQEMDDFTEFEAFTDTTEQTEPTDKKDKKRRIYTVSQLMAEDFEFDWAITDLMIANQATIIGGREKCFKTSIAVDLLYSLATGTTFLNRFESPKKRSSVLFTAEIGHAAAKNLIGRISSARGHNPSTVDNMFIADFVPSFYTSSANEKRTLNKINKILDSMGNPEIAVFDPLYFAMGEASVGDMYQIGDILNKITTLCTSRDIWPIFCHHAKKDNTKDGQPMELHDLYGAGVSAFARQWVLLSHASPFERGQAHMFCRFGGSSTGDRDVWDLKIDEGQLDEILTERVWNVTIKRADETSVGSHNDTDVLDQIPYDEAISVSNISAITGIPKKTIQASIKRLTEAKSIMCENGKFKRL